MKNSPGRIATPRLLEPLSAALVGAGFFFFAAAFAGRPWWQSLDAAILKALQPDLPLAGMLVEGDDMSPVASMRMRRLAEDLRALQALSPTTIVLEAWLDEPSQAEGRAALDEFSASLRSLTSSAAGPVLERLSQVGATLDVDEKLAKAIEACGNVLLPVEVAWGPSQVSPASLQAASLTARSAYEVTLKSGARQRLPGAVVLRAPQAVLAAAADGLVAVETLQESQGPVHGVAEVAGRWMNLAGFEAARRQLDVALQAQRFRWRVRSLVSVELKGVRFPLDENARFHFSENAPGLPMLSLAQLRQARPSLVGKTVFFRPWPGRDGRSPAWERQEKVFQALATQSLLSSPETSSRVLWALGALGLLALGALFPGWVFAAAWTAAIVAVLRSFMVDGAPLVFEGVLLMASLLSGGGMQIRRAWQKKDELDHWFAGAVHPSSRAHWRKAIPSPVRGASLEASCLHLQGDAMELESRLQAWSGQFPVLMKRSDVGLTVVLLGTELAPQAASLAALRPLVARSKLGMARGYIHLRAQEALGAVNWELSGEAVLRARALAALAKSGQWLLLEADYAPWRDLLRVQMSGDRLGEGPEDRVLNVLNFL